MPFPLPPTITQQPTDVSVVERESAAFAVAGSSLAPLSYQWQLNGGNIAGATSATYTIPIVALSQNLERYRCVLYSALGTNTTTEAVLNVAMDVVKPTIVHAANEGANRVLVIFSEPVDSVTGQTPGNFTINNGVSVSAATFFNGDIRTIALTTSTLVNGNTYTVTVSNVRDTAATPNPILAGSEKTFTAAAYNLVRMSNLLASPSTV